MENINDKLITWANNNGYWAQSMLQSCFANGEINTDKIQNIFDCYKNQTFDDINLTVKNTNITHKTYLKSIKNIKNVNKLLDNQELSFNNNLTVVYGSNGAGKTGYVRIIKSMGNSLDEENTIYSDLTEEEKENHTAEIRFYNGISDEDFSWDNKKPKQLNVKVFNSNCVRFSLGNKKEIQFIPEDFNFFNLINAATAELYKTAKEYLKKLQSDMTMLAIIDDTQVAKIIEQCKTKDVEKIVNDFISTNNLHIEDVNKKINELNEKSKKLTNDNISRQIADTLKEKDKIEELNNYIFIKSGLYNNSFWNDLKDNILEIHKLIKNNVKIEDFIENLNLDAKQKTLFKDFLLAADDFLKSKDGTNFADEVNCVFCGQPLNSKAKQLLTSYNNFISNDNSKQINKLTKLIEQHNKKISDTIYEINKIAQFFDGEHILTKQIKVLISQLEWFKNINFENELNEDEFLNNCNFETTKANISDIIKKYESKLKELETTKSKLDEAISSNRKELNELNSIAILLNNKQAIVKNIYEQKNIQPLTKISNSSLSAIQSNILTTKYKEKFNRTLDNQLTILEAPKNIKFAPNIVSSKLALQQSFLDKKYNLGNILSEGEQKVIALAHFIAENSMEEKDNILVFDDPVNSLDLQRVETVARVLVSLSTKKQIIIFTHNLVFVGFLSSFAKEILQNEEQLFVCVEKVFIDGKEYTGQIKYEFPNIETYKNYKTLLNNIMSNATEQSLGKDKMYECFEYMRSAVELLVVEKVFKGTVNRYEPDIKMGRFEAIDTEKLNQHGSRITTLFNKLCRYIRAHSSSAQARLEPDFNVLQECYNEFKELDSIFKQ